MKTLAYIFVALQFCLLSVFAQPGLAIRPSNVFDISTYNAYPSETGVNNRQRIQDCIDAAEAQATATGVSTVVQFGQGRYDLTPTSGGFVLVHDGRLCTLRGIGESTELRVICTGSSAAFCTIAPRGYDTTTVPYGAGAIAVQDLRFTCDIVTGTGASNYHDAIGIAHCPWAMVTHCGFEQGYYHAFEVNVSKNVIVADCYVYGTGNWYGVIIELDSMGACGQIKTTGGTLSQSTPIENVFILRFIQRVGRTDTSFDPTYDGMLLSHSNPNGVFRRIVVRDCAFIVHENPTVSGSTRTHIGWDTGAFPSKVDGLEISGCTFKGGLTGVSVILGLGTDNLVARDISNIVVKNNYFNGGFCYFLTMGIKNNDISPRTDISDSVVKNHDGLEMVGNNVVVQFRGNTINVGRSCRLAWLGACRHLKVSNNTVRYPDESMVSWGSSTLSTVYSFWVDHPQNLVFDNNQVEITRSQTAGVGSYPYWLQVYPYAFAAGAYEIQVATPVLTGYWQITGNTAVGRGAMGYNLAAGFLGCYTSGTTGIANWTASSKKTPNIRGYWSGNSAYVTVSGTFQHTLSTTYLCPCSGINNTALTDAQAVTLGCHDWLPQANMVGTVTTLPAAGTMPAGWYPYDGSLITALPYLAEINWNNKLGLSGTSAFPNTSNVYVRLTGE